jgi:hypothetical protein
MGVKGGQEKIVKMTRKLKLLYNNDPWNMDNIIGTQYTFECFQLLYAQF